MVTLKLFVAFGGSNSIHVENLLKDSLLWVNLVIFLLANQGPSTPEFNKHP